MEFTQHITNSTSRGEEEGVEGRVMVQEDIEVTYTDVPSGENVGMIVDIGV